MTYAPPPSEHVDPHEMVGYIESTLPPAERSRVEAHLSVCEDCTSELVAVSRLRRRAPRPVIRLGLAAAAAAVVAVVLLGPRRGRPPAVGEPPVRGDGAPTAVGIVAPAEDATLRAPVFTWRTLPGATAYRISISRADGDSVWAATVSDTTVRPPAGAVLPSPDPYYWYVDVLLPDGRSIAGTAHQFRLGP